MASPSSATYFYIQNIEDKKTDFLSFKILENAANGDCLFQSIMQFLEHDEAHEVPINVTDLRHKIVRYISHSSKCKRFVDTIIFNFENLLLILQKDDYSDTFKTKIYSNYMSQPNQYGTFAELQAASEIFNFVYVVFREEIRRSVEETNETWYSCYSSDDHKFKSKMFLLFSGKPSSGHFQFMKSILPKNIFVVPQGEYKTIEKYRSSDSLILSVKKMKDSSNVCVLCGK